jgi:hypothetical protein
MLLTSCGPTYSLDSGPLDGDACAHVVNDIAHTIKRKCPERRLLSIKIVDSEGEAQVGSRRDSRRMLSRKWRGPAMWATTLPSSCDM